MDFPFTPQPWRRDVDSPVISLGAAGEFDDMHLFAPCVLHEEGRYRLWYCGSRGLVEDRVLNMGLATSEDGRRFTKHGANPVFEFGDGRHSILTPTLLRGGDGNGLREDGRLRMWFAAADMTQANPPHRLHETSSVDGVHWEPPSPAQLENLYSPTVLKVGEQYRLWYADVSGRPWVFRHAASDDGRTWRVTPEPVVIPDQPWEHDRLFYPTVLQQDGLFLMWYGSYARPDHKQTALGFAVSEDGVEWRKYAGNPVFGPDSSRPWESHYTTSQSIIRFADGSWRIWYASRTAPPFVHKYFAVGTAVWP